MKKLMIALVAVAFGLCAQAATINWGFTWATDASGLDLADGTQVYLMAASAMSVADATTALDAYSFDVSKAIDVGLTSTAGGSGAEANRTISSDLSGSQTFYAVFINGDQYAITDPVTRTMATVGPTVVNFAELSLEDGTSLMTWKNGGVAIPEPTSGLLMLVGLAGLALRRKRA